MKPIRLIELFAGYGSQAMALKRLGLPFEHHFVCEFDKYAIKSYNAVHGTDFPVLDIRDLHASDLRITDKDKFNYLLTYSFPCTDLSIAGKMQGMGKGSGTRSGLLWEVERLLRECGENLPQFLMMENVPQVHGKKNINDFADWISFLDGLGYKSKWEDLNAKDFGIAQNRERCFMVSWLGSDVNFNFPKPRQLDKTMRDFLDEEVDERYFLKSEKAKKFLDQWNASEPKSTDGGCNVLGLLEGKYEQNGRVYDTNGTSPAICSRDYKEPKKIMVVGNMNATGEGFESSNRIYSPKGIAPCLNTSQGGGREPFIMSDAPVCLNSKGGRGGVEGLQPSLQDRIYSTEGVSVAIATGYHPQYLTTNRIRKLTETECLRLMGVTEEDIEKIKAKVSPTQCYKQAGNSIVVDVMVAIFDNLFNTAETGGQMSIYDYL